MDKTTFDKTLKTLAPQIEKIRQRAYYLHDVEVNQKYDGDKPYSLHVGGVMDLTMKYMHEIVEDENDVLPVIFGAAFHDSIEDARMTYNDVRNAALELGFTEEQALLGAEIAYALTNEKGRNRAERANDKYYKGIRETPYAPLVKMADRLFNMQYSLASSQQMLDIYRGEYPHFISSIEGEERRFSIPESMKQAILKILLK